MPELERRVDLIELSRQVATLTSEVAAIHKENAARDATIKEMSSDLKELLALANQGKGGFWAAMTMASFMGAVLSWAVTHLSLK